MKNQNPKSPNMSKEEVEEGARKKKGVELEKVIICQKTHEENKLEG